MLQQAVELPAVQRAPGAVEVVSGLRLMFVVAVPELEERKQAVRFESVQRDGV